MKFVFVVSIALGTLIPPAFAVQSFNIDQFRENSQKADFTNLHLICGFLLNLCASAPLRFIKIGCGSAALCLRAFA
jgi:hypothetical protein